MRPPATTNACALFFFNYSTTLCLYKDTLKQRIAHNNDAAKNRADVTDAHADAADAHAHAADADPDAAATAATKSPFS